MARARLHLICGNCGCADEWQWYHVPADFVDDEVVSDEDVFISCRNCATLHSLNNNAVNESVAEGSKRV